MLIVKQAEIEYEGFHDGYHRIRRLRTGSIELVKEFKLVKSKEIVEMYRADGTHCLTYFSKHCLENRRKLSAKPKG